MPVSALIGALITVGDLQRYHELVAVWNTGMSPLRQTLILMPAALLIVVLQAAVDDQAVPASTKELRAWGVGAYRHRSLLEGADGTLWLRSGQDVVNIPGTGVGEESLRDITIFRRDEDGLLTERLDVARATHAAAHWQLEDVVRMAPGEPRSQEIDHMRWDGVIDLDHVALMAIDPRELTLARIATIIENDAFAMRPITLYETWFRYRIADVFAPLLMVAVATVLGQRFGRVGSFTRLFLSGVGLGFLFFIASGAAVALGEVGILTPTAAAFGPTAAMTALVAVLLLVSSGVPRAIGRRTAPA
jgi:lipopolysaccharide export system permease protein